MAAKKYPEVQPGQRYGRLVVLERAARTNSKQAKWVCMCDCGKETAPFQFSLNAGKSNSCGCVAAEKSKALWASATPDMFLARAKNATNRTHSMSKHGAFRSWSDMKSRCLNPTHKWYPSYGGRGVTVAGNWLTFAPFWADMGDTWFPGAQIGRSDNDGNYEPSNVSWETPAQQQNNKSNNIFLDTPSGRMTVSQAARHFNIGVSCLSYRVKAGFPADKLFQPSQRTQP